MDGLRWVLITIDIIILCIYFDDKCDQPFNYWIMFNIFGNFIQYLNRNKEENSNEESKYRINYFIGLGLTIFLSIIYFSSKTCKNTPLYNYMTFYVIIYFLFYGILTIIFLFEILVILLCVCCSILISICPSSRIERSERRRFARELAIAAREAINEENIPVLPFRNRLPTFRYSLTNVNNIECSICLSQYIENDNVNRLECNHNFHKECIEEWLHINPTCPLCRKVINETV